MADSDSESDIVWLIVYAPRDDSFSLIRDDDAVCDKEHIGVGDELKFYYGGEEWEGIVRAIGGDEEYDSLKVRMDKLNAERKAKNNSFNEGKPRKTRGKGKYEAALEALKPRSKSNPLLSMKTKSDKLEAKAAKTKNNNRANQPLQKESESSSGSDSESDRSPPSSPLPEWKSCSSRRKDNQVKRKHTIEDINFLKKLRTNGTDMNGNHAESQLDSTKVSAIDSTVQIDRSGSELGSQNLPSLGFSASGSFRTSTPARKGSERNNTSAEPIKRTSIVHAGSDSTLYDADSDFEDVEKEAGGQKGHEDREEKKKKKKRSQKDKNETEEPKETNRDRESVLRWKEGDADVVLVQGRSKDLVEKNFYISCKDLQDAKQRGNASTFAKSLLVAAFTDEALFTHSLSGGQYRAAGKDKITQKPALLADVVAVIVDVSLHRQSAKKWNPLQSRKEILSGLRQKLVDIRPRLKKVLNL